MFTKAANEIRTSSEMACESNRGNVLSIVVKDHLHARRQLEQKARQAQRPGRTGSAAAASAPPPPSASPGRREPKERVGARETDRSRGEGGAGAKGRGNSRTQSQGPEPLPSLPRPPLVLSTKMAKMPPSEMRTGTSPPQSDRGNSGDGGIAPANPSRKRRRGAQNAPPARRRGGAPNASPSRLPRSSGVQAKDALPPGDAGAAGAGAPAAWGVRRLGLPPLEERYPNAKDGWVYSPVELRLQRPRCKSVDVASLDQPAYKEYMKRVLRAGAAATRHESVGAETSGQERRATTDRGEGNRNRLGSNLVEPKRRDRTSSRSFFDSPNRPPPVQEEEVRASGGGGGGGGVGYGSSSERGDNSEHCVSFLSPATQISPVGGEVMETTQGGPRGVGKGYTATAAADALPAHRDDHCLVRGNGHRRRARSNHDPWSSAKTTPVLIHTLSRFQLRDGEGRVFHLTSCDAEGGRAPRQAADRGNGDSTGSSAASTVDDALASEALRLRSKGARKVFKQTQRLLDALRTPASSSQTTSTGSRRGCGGGSMGGHSSVVVHHRGGAGDAVNGGGRGGGHGGPDLTSFPGRDDEVWRVARGSRRARLAEVLRCVVPPHTVRIECEILLHEALSGRDGDAGAGVSQSGTWDDFVFAWEVSVCVYSSLFRVGLPEEPPAVLRLW